VRRPWTIADFAMVWLAGVFGSLAFLGMGRLLSPEANLILITLAGQYFGILGAFWLMSRRKVEPDIGLAIEPKDMRYVGLGILLQIGSALLIEPLARMLYPEGRPPQEIADAIADPSASLLIKLGIVSAAVVFAPLTEEIMFRGVLFKAMRHRGRWFAVVVTALVFTTVHILGLDPNNMLASAAVVLPPILVLGLVLAWLTDRTGRLGPAIFLHSGWNLLAALVLLIPGDLLESLA
jgi:uncharacterized protein